MNDSKNAVAYFHPRTPCCGKLINLELPYPVYWNADNKVVQCHACGVVFDPSMPGLQPENIQSIPKLEVLPGPNWLKCEDEQGGYLFLNMNTIESVDPEPGSTKGSALRVRLTGGHMMRVVGHSKERLLKRLEMLCAAPMLFIHDDLDLSQPQEEKPHPHACACRKCFDERSAVVHEIGWNSMKSMEVKQADWPVVVKRDFGVEQERICVTYTEFETAKREGFAIWKQHRPGSARSQVADKLADSLTPKAVRNDGFTPATVAAPEQVHYPILVKLADEKTVIFVMNWEEFPRAGSIYFWKTWDRVLPLDPSIWRKGHPLESVLPVEFADIKDGVLITGKKPRLTAANLEEFDDAAVCFTHWRPVVKDPKENVANWTPIDRNDIRKFPSTTQFPIILGRFLEGGQLVLTRNIRDTGDLEAVTSMDFSAYTHWRSDRITAAVPPAPKPVGMPEPRHYPITVTDVAEGGESGHEIGTCANEAEFLALPAPLKGYSRVWDSNGAGKVKLVGARFYNRTANRIQYVTLDKFGEWGKMDYLRPDDYLNERTVVKLVAGDFVLTQNGDMAMLLARRDWDKLTCIPCD